jgi:hypothetical protein
MFDWNSAIDKHNASKKQENLLEMLDRLVENILADNRRANVLEEEETTQRGDRKLTLGMIPFIPVSEIGWSSISTPEAGIHIPSEQRAQLKNFLENIQGTDLKEKIESLNRFYSGENKDFLRQDTNGKVIAAAISYLTFYKTLTMILTNFNSASAGFSFEAFLAVLLNGKQVPTGEGTIADLIAGDGSPVSLKLYKEGNLEVGGSFTDLSRDLRKSQYKNMMQYVAVTKTLTGKGLEQEGTLKWFRFNFNLDNIFNIIANSSKSSSINVLLPKPFMDTNGDSVEGIPAKAAELPSAEEMETKFYQIFDKKIQNPATQSAIVSQTERGDKFDYEALKQMLDFAKNDELFGGSKIRGKDKLNTIKLKKILAASIFLDNQKFKAGNTADSELYKVIISSYVELMDQNKRTQLEKERQHKLNEVYFWDHDREKLVKTSVDFYNKASPELKIKCLEYSYGYISTGHFNLTQGMVENIDKLAGANPGNLFPPGQNGVLIGQLNIGSTYIQKMLNDVSSIINSSVFDIFDNLSVLTTDIQGYFAGGLKDDSKADSAMKAANNIETKTREVSNIEK